MLEILPEVEESGREEIAHSEVVQAILQEIQETLGTVPGFLRAAEGDPELLAAQWQLVKRYTVEATRIPAKYRALIGLAVASAVHCRYCATHHRGVAQAHGATAEELDEAAALAQYTAGLSAFVDGHLLSPEEAAAETARIQEHLQR